MSDLIRSFDVSPPAAVGRFAPSPSGHLHLGNLRTAVFAQQMTRHSAGGQLLIRLEDLDPVACREEHADSQLKDLKAIGVESSGWIVRQSERTHIYKAFLNQLDAQGEVYECFCTRREVRDAARAPHGEFFRYPGTCRELDSRTRASRRGERSPALRLRVDDKTREEGAVDDIVLCRNDGVPAYNLAVVVDDSLQGITQVVRGIDLEPVTPSQVYLQQLLGFPTPEYVHVGLVVGPDGERLAKRHGSVTLADWLAAGRSASSLREALLRTLADRPIQAECPVSDIWGE
jgi:glutamyl-tRNA synthetase